MNLNTKNAILFYSPMIFILIFLLKIWSHWSELPEIITLQFCDLVVCRSGAMTMTEITNAGLPAVMIPLKFAAENHQEKNARTLENAGAGIVVLDNNIDSVKFFKDLNSLLETPKKLKEMSENSKKLGNPNANENI